MPRKDYESLDEHDFYGQDFDQEGVVSVWVGVNDFSGSDDDLDALQDLCGVGYYNPDNQESNCKLYELIPLKELLSELSFSSSFIRSALEAALALGINEARWVVVQYDFAYSPMKVKRRIENDPIFLGVFPYKVES